ncbi:hypothetical protein FY137_18290 [Agrobacterium tumefaciens]|nr:hypothetical protein FY137_18290 [Agrobacterium tumefaciens]
MPFDSNGNYTLPTSYFVENGDTVLPIQHNPPFEDVAQALSATLLRDGRSPMSGDLKMGTKKITFLGDGSATTDAVTKGQLDAAVAILSDPWAFQPIGVPIPANMGIGGWSAPPTNKSYKYIVLSAGQTGAGGYNQGLLTGESVTGSAPNINATATISVAGSPLNGSAATLLNTSREYLRPGNIAVQENSQNASHAHTYTDPTHGHGLSIFIGSTGTGNAFNQAAVAANENPTTRGSTTSSGVGITILASGGDEARPRARGVNYYMRVL